VFSSLRDSFGGVVLEAAERATPSVVPLHSGIQGLAEWLPTNAAWAKGATSRRSFIDALAAGMVESTTCTEETWLSRSNAAYAFACDHGWDRRGERMADLYRQLLHR
jgi:hypothetical protein